MRGLLSPRIPARAYQHHTAQTHVAHLSHLRAKHLGDAEVGELDDSVLGAREHDVVTFQVSVQDVAGVDVSHCENDLHKHLPNLVLQRCEGNTEMAPADCTQR